MTERPPDARPSMMDVARHVGVSHQTVSRVVNEHPNVRASTREQVLAAMRELGYRPNVAARILATGRSQTIGVIGLNSTLFGPAATMHGVDNAARDARYRLLTVSLDSIDRPSVSDAIDRLATSGADGIIVIAPLSSAREAIADLPIGVPTVMVNAHPDSRIATVSVDQVYGARLATEHLIATGRGPVWHVAGPLDWTESQDRMEGWRQAMAVAGVEASPLLVGDWSARSGYEAGHVLAGIPEARSVFVGNDHMALGMLRAFHERGRSVPDDVCVVGFDDIPEAAYVIPPLTTVRQDFGEVGRNCVRLLIEQIDTGTRSSERHVVVPELVVRHSSEPSLASQRLRSYETGLGRS